jgi:hypothetical protein
MTNDVMTPMMMITLKDDVLSKAFLLFELGAGIGRLYIAATLTA